MHDFGKKGNVITKGHAQISEDIVKNLLKHRNLDEEEKNRIIKQVKNHHWFEGYNKKWLNKEDILKIFDTKEDLTIAKILAKSDLEAISSTFHRKILIPNKVLTQKEFDNEYKKIIDFIQ